MFKLFNNLKLRLKIVYTNLLILIILISAFFTIYYLTIITKEKKSIAAYQTEEIKKIKTSLQSCSEITLKLVESFYQRATEKKLIEKYYGTRLKTVVDMGKSIIHQKIDEVKKKKISLAAAKLQVINEIKNIRYDNGTGYIWINDTTRPIPRMIMHPTLPETDGTILDDPKYNCALGIKKNLFVAFVDVCLEAGEGFVDYLWPKPTANGLTKEMPKLSYVTLIPEWNWIIGTGVYLDDAERDAITDCLNEVRSIRYNNGLGYFWVNDLTFPAPVMLANDLHPNLEGKVLISTDYNTVIGNNNNFYLEATEIARVKGDGFVEYLDSKPEGDSFIDKVRKLSYIKIFKPWGWVIGTGAYLDDMEKDLAQKENESRQVIRQMIYLMTASSLALFVFLILLSSIVSRTIVKKFTYIRDELKKIATGDLSIRMGKNLLELKDEIGDFSRSLDTVLTDLNSLIYEINTSANGILSGSNQVSDSAQSLSHAASELASSVEETSSSIEQMDATIDKNVENSIRCENLAIQVSSEIQEGGEAVKNTVESMKKITSAVQIITEIANNTNMLALNAAIEAARAQEHGEGFAVVASEVRKLAERTLKKAEEIKTLSANSVDIADKAGNLISMIIPKIIETTDMVQEISSYSKEQKNGMKQLTASAVQQDKIAQLVSANSEELASSSEEMMSQAKSMVSLIDVFKLNNEKMEKISEQLVYQEERTKKVHENQQFGLREENLPELDSPKESGKSKKNKLKSNHDIKSDDIDGSGGFIEL